jgi:hypothetical protein
LDPIRIRIQPKMLDPDPYRINTDPKPWAAVPVNAPLVEDDHDGEQEVMGEEGGLGQHLHPQTESKSRLEQVVFLL